MKKNEVKVSEWLKNYVSDSLGFKEEITRETRLDELRMDSLDSAEFVVEAEKKFSISLTDELMSKINTMGELEDAIITLLPDDKV